MRESIGDMRCTLPYGTGRLTLNLPDAWNVTLIERRPMPPMGHFSLIRYRKN